MKPNRAASMPRGGRLKNRNRRPFWLPAINYYILTAFVTIVLFFIILAVTSEGRDENSIGLAAIGAGAILSGAVFLREVVLRNARQRYLAAQKQLDSQIEKVFAQNRNNAAQKITLEQNAAMLKEISNKSNAAKVFSNLPETHREVFEVCNEYLSVSKTQMKNAGAGSPRLAAFRSGREFIKQLHRYHLLEWVQGESRILTNEAKQEATIEEKLNSVQKAMNLIVRALLYYPHEPRLVESEIALNEYITSLEIYDLMEQAGKALSRGEIEQSADFYRKAVLALEHGKIQQIEKEIIRDKIKQELEKISQLEKHQPKIKKETFSAVTHDLKDIYD